jgi:hypothetical protein
MGSGMVPVRGRTVLDGEGLKRKTTVAGSVTDAFMWRKQLSGLHAFAYEKQNSQGCKHGVGWPMAMAWLGVGAGWAALGGRVGRMPRGKLGHLRIGPKGKRVLEVFKIVFDINYEWV